MRLGAEDRHAVAGRIARDQLLDRATAGHAVADHDEMLAGVAGDRVFHQIVQSGWSRNGGGRQAGMAWFDGRSLLRRASSAASSSARSSDLCEAEKRTASAQTAVPATM